MRECVIDVSWGDDPASFHRSDVRDARKNHKCGECGKTIKPGEKYENTFAIWDEPITCKTCSVCLELRNKLFCSWTYETIWEDIEEEIRDSGLKMCAIDGLSISAVEALSDCIRRMDENWEPD